MAGFIKPMKAASDTVPPGDGWAADLKWDGMRLLAEVSDGRLRLWSGSGRVVTTNFPELEQMVDAVGIDATIDGECVVFDDGRPSFNRLQHRIHVSRPTASLIEEHPVFFVAFDLLELDQRSLLDLGFVDRRRLLASLLEDGPNWRVPPYSENDGAALLALARDRGLEGIVCKRLDSPYRPGQRSPDWIKIKVRKRQEFVVGGWLPGSRGLSGSLGSLLVGIQENGRLVFAGAAGSGLSDDMRRHLMTTLVPVEVCPFDSVPETDRSPRWVEPRTVVEVEYSLWPEGGLLWHPTFRGLRVDRDPGDVIRETVSEDAVADDHEVPRDVE